MIGYFNNLSDPKVEQAVNAIVDAANSFEARLNDTADTLAKLKIPTMRDIQKNLQQGGSNPLNLTGLQGRGGITGAVLPQ